MPAMSAPPRCAILPPVPVPYREPLFAALAERGRIDPRVVYQSARQPGWDQRADWFPERHRYESTVLRSWQRARPGRSPVTLPRGLGRALRAQDPEVVVSSEYGPATLRALGWCRVRRRPLLVMTELTPENDAQLASAQLRLHRLLAPRLAGFVALSGGARERLIAIGVEPGRIEVSLQSADVERFRAAAGRRHTRGGPVRVLSVGRLVPDKNLDTLLHAFAAAGLSDGEAELEIVGSGPLEGELRSTAERLSLPARFRGYVEPDALPALYAEADVLALVSRYEPFGVTVREGVAAGLPILCTAAAGAAGDFAREGHNAVLVDPGDLDAAAAALRGLVRDPALRERLAAGSRALADATPLEADVEAFERAVLRAAGRL
jgi:glycosyltransferase involved in cell wall biosynthesis